MLELMNYNIGNIKMNAEIDLVFPQTFGDFISNGNTDHDYFESIKDGDPVIRTYNNFTINEGHTVTTSNRCKGLYLNILGDLVVNGSLSMTARGANVPGKFVGIDTIDKKIYYDDENIYPDSFIVINKKGASGVPSGIIGSKVSNDGINGACGAGGATGGKAYRTPTFAESKGGDGTSFSGGSGAGGGVQYHIDGVSYDYFKTGNPGAENGGPGGNGMYVGYALPADDSGGGAGNPGGICSRDLTRNGEDGTGGLIILFVRGNIIFGPDGSIQSNGSTGGKEYYVKGRYTSEGGGGSGGGAIHIIHNKSISDLSKIIALGGKAGYTTSNVDRMVLDGGNGTVNIVKI